MPIVGVIQPEIIQIDENIRLRRYSKKNGFALKWYQEADTLMLVNSKKEPYSLRRLNKMYEYLEEHGEVYFIEIIEHADYSPIGLFSSIC